MQYYKNTEDAPTFAEQYEATYGNPPTFLDYIKAGGITAGLTCYYMDKKPESQAGALAFAFSLLLLPILAIVFALPILILFIVVGLAKK